MFFMKKWNNIYNMFADIARSHPVIGDKFSFIYLGLITFLLLQIMSKFIGFEELFGLKLYKKSRFFKNISLQWIAMFMLALLINVLGQYFIDGSLRLIWWRSIVIPHAFVLLAIGQLSYYLVQKWRKGEHFFDDVPSYTGDGEFVDNSYFRYLEQEAQDNLNNNVDRDNKP